MTDADAVYRELESRGVLWHVLQILIEAYNPLVICRKLPTTIRIRTLKVLGLLFNQRTGKWCCGWNGHENRLYDDAGFYTDRLFFQLYGRPLLERDVRLFLHRRLHYAFITAVVTAMQIVATYYDYVSIATLLSCLLAPVTLIDRQWATSVTKNPPRYMREVIVNHLQWPLTEILLTRAKTSPEPELGKFKPPQRIRMPRWASVLVAVEIFNGFFQFVTGLLLFVMPIMIFFWWDMRQFDLGGKLSMLWCLNIFRIMKELCNWISPLIERKLTPVKYGVSEKMLTALLESLSCIDLELLLMTVFPPSDTADGSIQVDGDSRVAITMQDDVLDDHRTRLRNHIARMLDSALLQHTERGDLTQEMLARSSQSDLSLDNLPHFLQTPQVRHNAQHASILCGLFCRGSAPVKPPRK